MNAKSVMRWIRSTSTSRRDWMVCPRNCTWSCRTCSTTGSYREPYLDMLSRMWSITEKSGMYVWKELDYNRPITLLNTEIKILAWVLTNRLQIVTGDLIGTEKNYAVKGRSIQNDPHLAREIIEGIEDDKQINLNQSEVGPSVFSSGSRDCQFEPRFRRWISILYHNPTAVV